MFRFVEKKIVIMMIELRLLVMVKVSRKVCMVCGKFVLMMVSIVKVKVMLVVIGMV